MTIFHKYLPNIHIHPILLIFIFISFITGTFMELSIILSIVFIHELGHYTMARIYNWRIQSIMLWVFGGVMNTEEHGNRPLLEEGLVIIAGPIQHLFIYFIVQALYLGSIIPQSILELILFYNLVILLFNLLPIWPLDGGKLLLIIFSYVLPFRKAYHYTIIFSMITCLILLIMQLLFLPFTFSSFIIFLFLLMENRTEWKQRYYVFIRFLLNRYEGKTPVKNIDPITVTENYLLMDVFARFRREKKHLIYIQYSDQQRKTLDESDCLHYYFSDKKYHQTIGELVKYHV